MPSLKDLRRRTASVKNTRQITKAMKLVSAAKLRRAQEAIDGARPFAQKLEELTHNVVGEISATLANLDESKRAIALKNLHPLLRNAQAATESGEKNKIALLVVSSDRGLCGAYNNNVLRAAYKRAKEISSNPHNELSLYFVGRRGADFLKKRDFDGHWFEDFWTGKFSTIKSDKVARLLTDKFISGDFHSVEVIFTQFKSVISQEVQTKQLLPLSLPIPEVGSVAEAELNDTAPFIYEPKREALLAELLPQQVMVQFYRVFADSLASEFGARMTAMDNATRNAEDMISRLTLQANRVRQAAITSEICEIVGGAEALKHDGMN